MVMSHGQGRIHGADTGTPSPTAMLSPGFAMETKEDGGQARVGGGEAEYSEDFDEDDSDDAAAADDAAVGLLSLLKRSASEFTGEQRPEKLSRADRPSLSFSSPGGDAMDDESAGTRSRILSQSSVSGESVSSVEDTAESWRGVPRSVRGLPAIVLARQRTRPCMAALAHAVRSPPASPARGPAPSLAGGGRTA